MFDVIPIVDGRCKTPIGDIQAAVDGAISPEQTVKLRQCLNHTDELEKHLEEDEQLCELTLRHLLHIERHIRSSLSYAFCDKFGDQQTAYLNPANYDNIRKKINAIIRNRCSENDH